MEKTQNKREELVTMDETCFECGQPLRIGEAICPVTGHPERMAHRYCRYVVVSTALAAMGH